MFPLLLVGALLVQAHAAPSSIRLKVGSFVLLTRGAPDRLDGRPRTAPTVTDAQGHPVSSRLWLNRPLKIAEETKTAYLLAEGKARVWLPKQLLETKSVFPLSQTSNSRALARAFGRATVFVNGQPFFPCEVADGYHALVTTKTAHLVSVWSVEGDDLNLFPREGPNDVTPPTGHPGQTMLVVLTPTAGVRFMGAELELALQDQSSRLMAQVSQRCTILAGLFPSPDAVRRVFSTARPPGVPTLPNGPDAQERALIGWTKAQVLAQYGSPNEPGKLQAILKLKAWSYGQDAYSSVEFRFGADDRVVKAVVGRSP